MSLITSSPAADPEPAESSGLPRTVISSTIGSVNLRLSVSSTVEMIEAVQHNHSITQKSEHISTLFKECILLTNDVDDTLHVQSSQHVWPIAELPNLSDSNLAGGL